MPFKLCGLVTLAGVLTLSASTLSIVTSNIPAEANKLAIMVDGGGINGFAYVILPVTAGATVQTHVFSPLPDGPFRARVLAYNDQSRKVLRSGRSLNAAANGTANVMLGDVGAPYPTTTNTFVGRGTKATVSFRIPDPGGWLEGMSPTLSASAYAPVESLQLNVQGPPLQNLSASGSWEYSMPLQIPISGFNIGYSLGITFFLPCPRQNSSCFSYPLPAEWPGPIPVWGSQDFLYPENHATVRLSISGLPAGTDRVRVFADRGQISGTVSALFDAASPATNLSFGLPAGGNYRLRVAAINSNQNGYGGTLIASGQTGVLTQQSQTADAIVTVRRTSVDLDPSNPKSGSFMSYIPLAFEVTDAGSVLENLKPYIRFGTTQPISGVFYGEETRFQQVAADRYRGRVHVQLWPAAAAWFWRPTTDVESGSLSGLDLGLPDQSITSTGISPCGQGVLSSITVPARGGAQTNSYHVGGCAWTSTSSAPWILHASQSGFGAASIRYAVAPNFGAAARNGSIFVGGRPIFLTQEGSTDSDDVRFVKLLYHNFLVREPAAAEIKGWTDALTAGTSRRDVAVMFAAGREFQLGGRFISGLYFGLLARDAEFSGWLHQLTALAAGFVTQTSLVGNFLNSEEYKLRFGTPDDAGFVRLLYRHILLREASQGEVDFQAGALKNGIQTRTTLAATFLNSPEFALVAGPRLTAFVLHASTLR